MSSSASRPWTADGSVPEGNVPLAASRCYGFTAAERAQQQAAIANERAVSAAAQAARVSAEHAGAIPASARVRLLVAEGYRYELRRIDKCRALLLLREDQAAAAREDVRVAYRALLREIAMTLSTRRAQGCSEAEEQALAAQAIARFASLFPWSDSVLVNLSPAEAAPLLARRHAAVGRTGRVLPLSLGATPVCAQAKNAEAANARSEMMRVAEEERRRAQQQQQQQQRRHGGASISAGSSDYSASSSFDERDASNGPDEDEDDERHLQRHRPCAEEETDDECVSLAGLGRQTSAAAIAA